MKVDEPLEVAFAMPIIDKFRTYRVCSNHQEHEEGKSNEYPYFMLHFFELMPDIELPDPSLEHRVHQGYIDELYEDREWLKENLGFDIFFDLNAYRIIAKIPFIDLYNERRECEEELDYTEDDPEHRQYLIERIGEIDRETVECASHLKKFEEWFEGHKNGWIERLQEYVIAIDDDEEFSFVSKEFFDDMQDTHNWHIWNPICKMCDEKHDTEEGARMCEDQHIEERDEFYQEWIEKRNKEKLVEAGSSPLQTKLIMET